MKSKQEMIDPNSTIRALTTLHPFLFVVMVSLMIVSNTNAQIAPPSSGPSQAPTETNMCEISSLPACQIDYSFLTSKDGGRKSRSSKDRFSSSKGKGKGDNEPTNDVTVGVPICIANTCHQATDTDNIDAIVIASYETVCVDPRELVGSTFPSNGGGTMVFMKDEETIMDAFVSCGCCPGYQQTDMYPNYCIESTISCDDNNVTPQPSSPTDTACMIPKETCESGKGKSKGSKTKMSRFSDATGSTRQRKLRRERYENDDGALPSTITTTTYHDESLQHRDLRYAVKTTEEEILSLNGTTVLASSRTSGKGKSRKEEEGMIMGVSVCFNGQEFCLDPLNPKEVAFASTDGVTCGGCN